MQPGKAIKLHCKDCQPENKTSALCKDCYLNNSGLYNLKRIKAYCKWCLNGYRTETCNSPECSLYIFRNGKNPNRSGIGYTHSQNMIKLVS